VALATVTLATNIASGNGGGLQIQDGSLAMADVQFYNNDAANAGGLHVVGEVVSAGLRWPGRGGGGGRGVAGWLLGCEQGELPAVHWASPGAHEPARARRAPHQPPSPGAAPGMSSPTAAPCLPCPPCRRSSTPRRSSLWRTVQQEAAAACWWRAARSSWTAPCSPATPPRL
jgi:hypothetical protein